MKRVVIIFLVLVSGAGISATTNNATVNGKVNITGSAVITKINVVEQPNPYNFDFLGLVISNRWLSATFATNATGITDWIDETNHFHWVLFSDSNPLTNSSRGVWLGAGKYYMLGTNSLIDADRVTFFIFNFQGPGPGQAMIFQDKGLGSGAGWGISDQNYPDPPSRFALKCCDINTSKLIISNAQYNVIYFGATVGSGTVYTNGVLASTAETLCSLSTNIIGSAPVDLPHNGFNGFLRETIVFTNKTITALQISNLNYYVNQLP